MDSKHEKRKLDVLEQILGLNDVERARFLAALEKEDRAIKDDVVRILRFGDADNDFSG